MSLIESKESCHRLPTLEEKVRVYECLLHDINTHAAITMRVDKVHELIGLICHWSYAHRQGNGENSDEEQQELINRSFWRIAQKIG